MTYLPSARIDRDSPVPFYFQLSALIEQEIARGRWEPGRRLPSEPALGTHFALSRTTVRQALARLEQEGLIRRDKGRGTFVIGTRPRTWLLQSPDGFFHDEVDRMGRTVTSRLLRCEVAPLPGFAADALGLPEGSDGVVVERVRSVDGRIALFVCDYLPRSLAGALADELGSAESLYERLRDRLGLEVAGGRRALEAVKAGERLARLLEIDAAAPVIFVDSVAWDRNLQPFHCYRSWLRTDRMRVEIQVSSASGFPDRAVVGSQVTVVPYEEAEHV
jgi:GntR family transcriptional regulator